jgi:hypothetical protein
MYAPLPKAGRPDEFMKKSPKMCPKSFLSKLIHNLYVCTVEKSSPRICAACVFFRKLPKDNNRPIGEN